MKPTVLISTTTRWFPTARLATALSNAGFRVEALCPSGHPLNKTGSLARDYYYNGLRPIASFANAITASKADLVIPGDDLAARQLYQLYRQKLERHGPADSCCSLIVRSLGSAESFPTIFGRTLFIEMARAEGVRAPETAELHDSGDLDKWTKTAKWPVVLKADGTSGGDGVKIVKSLEEAKQAYRILAAPPLLARAVKRTLLDQDCTLLRPSLLRHGSIVNFQEFVPGCEATSAIACWNGAVLASVQFEVIQKAHARGHATVLQKIENSDMSNAAERIVSRLQLSGLHGLDFMLNKATGEAHLIEINPRSTQVGHLAFGPGHDLSGALYAAVTGDQNKPASRTTENDLVALFPQEWVRDAASPFLSSAYHDVPWGQQELVQACVRSRRTQSAWYSIESAQRNPEAVRVSGADESLVSS